MSYEGCNIEQRIINLDKALAEEESVIIPEHEDKEYAATEISVAVYLSSGKVLEPLVWHSETQRFVKFNVLPHHNKVYSLLEINKENIICIGLHNTVGLRNDVDYELNITEETEKQSNTDGLYI